MQKKKLLLIITLSLFPVLQMMPEAEATPAFSRQTGADCRSCHFMDMHGLNAFGRAFKQNAFNLSEHMKEQLQRQKQSEHEAKAPEHNERDQEHGCASC
ncbi:hypothetical protein FE236_13305 [Mariprofundus erugo]|uniref:hypothetical protein n=1 Tax=Mariprofundus erugo TaxID=2528639 RepID=UPI0010FD173D|nr:hypothetical protein [Mariprofundus erugo]TLS73420.1 hypothetical protein FE236_13305 [Mariprofundus erugo]